MSSPPPPPQVSPDGKFYWDGTRWVPMPTHGPAPIQGPSYAVTPTSAPPAQVQVRGQMPGWIAIAGLVICPPIGLLMVGFTRWSVMTKVGAAIASIVAWIIFLALVNHH
jgi:hypothetical protein